MFSFSSFSHQASTSIIYFTETLWPEFTFWHLLAGVFYYQRHYKKMANVRKSLNQFTNFMDNESISLNFDQARQKLPFSESDKSPRTGNFSQKAIEFLEKFDKRKHNKLLELSNMKLPNDTCEQTQVEITEITSNLQTIC